MHSHRDVGISALTSGLPDDEQQTGQQKFLLELPRAEDTLRNPATRDGKLFCAPGAENTTLLALRHSKMMSNTQNVANLAAYSGYHLVANGES